MDNARFEATSSRYALVTACNVLMNVVVLEPKLIQDDAAADRTFKFIVRNLPSLTNAGECETGKQKQRLALCNAVLFD